MFGLEEAAVGAPHPNEDDDDEDNESSEDRGSDQSHLQVVVNAPGKLQPADDDVDMADSHLEHNKCQLPAPLSVCRTHHG